MNANPPFVSFSCWLAVLKLSERTRYLGCFGYLTTNFGCILASTTTGRQIDAILACIVVNSSIFSGSYTKGHFFIFVFLLGT